MPPTLTVIWKSVVIVLSIGLVGWIFFQRLKRAEEPREMIVRWFITALVLGGLLTFAARAQNPVTRGIAIVLSLISCIVLMIVWRRALGEVVGGWISSLYTGEGLEGDAVPLYSIAEARRKQGKYLEAIEEIEGQLARFPTDFSGWMMLAEVQAEDLKDLASACQTVERVLEQPNLPPKNLAYALNREADWHLKLNRDPESARAALERIVQSLPESEQAHWALQRIAHLATPEMLAEKHSPHLLSVKPGEENVGLRTQPLDIKPVEVDPAAETAQLVERLEQFPYESEARERLALLYAKHYRRLDLATDQLEQLISYPNQPMRQVVHWLNLLADLQIELAGDAQLARQTLQRIIDQFPKTATAENALNRIAYLKLELRPKQEAQVVRLGSYEQNIGLKGSPGGRRNPG